MDFQPESALEVKRNYSIEQQQTDEATVRRWLSKKTWGGVEWAVARLLDNRTSQATVTPSKAEVSSRQPDGQGGHGFHRPGGNR